MNEFGRNLIRDWVPPILLRARSQRLNNQIRWRGDYATWQAAQAACSGYAENLILERVSAAVTDVLAGKAAYERDSVCFAHPSIRYPVLAACQLAATCRPNATVVDFGGSLGSAWLQHRHLLAPLGLRWRVVEQPSFVKRGRQLFPDGQPSFHHSLTEACPDEPPTLALFGAVLPYLEDPAAVLTEIIRFAPTWILIDRTSIHDHDRDRISIQEVPASIYRAAYPCRLFAPQTIPDLLTPAYTMIDEYSCDEGVRDPSLRFRGWLFARRSRS